MRVRWQVFRLDMQIASDLSTETAPSGNTQFTLRFEYQADADSFLQIVLPLIEGLHGASADAVAPDIGWRWCIMIRLAST